MALNLFVDISDNALLASSQQNQQVDPSQIPLFYGDAVVTVNVYLFSRNTQITNPSVFQFNAIALAGQLTFYLDDGKAGGVIYSAQPTWAPDPTNTFFTASIALNTTTLQTVFNANPSGPLLCWMHIGLNGNTILAQQVNIRVGLPQNTFVVPPPLTPLSLQQAEQMFVLINPPNGQVIYLKSPTGHTLALAAVDNGDGTCSFQASQLN